MERLNRGLKQRDRLQKKKKKKTNLQEEDFQDGLGINWGIILDWGLNAALKLRVI